jgi:transcriptional regulator with XRE-family HTH domain
MELRKAFARNLRNARNSEGVSQEELAHRAELDRTYVSALERCLYSASLDTIERLAKALRVEPASLLAKPQKDMRGRAR